MSFLFIVVLCFSLILFAGCGSPENDTPHDGNRNNVIDSIDDSEETVDPVEEHEVESEKEIEQVVDRKSKIEKAIRDRIDDGDYLSAKLTKININDNLGADDGTCIALIYFDFDIKNTRNTANEMMRMYSDDLVATLANQGITDISEAAVFWKDDYNNRNVKYAYEYRNGNFYVADIAGE